MATSLDFIHYVMDQLPDLGIARYRKMFGEYMVYVQDRPILLVCDDLVYVKMLTPLEEIMKDANRGVPYEGAKEHYLLDLDNSSLVQKVIPILVQNTPIPKSRNKKISN